MRTNLGAGFWNTWSCGSSFTVMVSMVGFTLLTTVGSLRKYEDDHRNEWVLAYLRRRHLIFAAAMESLLSIDVGIRTSSSR